jgi:hypothetical protein
MLIMRPKACGVGRLPLVRRWPRVIRASAGARRAPSSHTAHADAASINFHHFQLSRALSHAANSCMAQSVIS